MSLDQKEVLKEINSSLERIEKGHPNEATYLKALLIMNGIESKNLNDTIASHIVIGDLSRSNFIDQKNDSLLLCGIKKEAYDDKNFAHGEISFFSEKVSKKYGCKHYVIDHQREREEFFMDYFKKIMLEEKPTSVVFHQKGKTNYSEFVSFKGTDILAGGLAHNWDKSLLKIELFSNEKLTEDYLRNLKRGYCGSSVGFKYTNCSKINDTKLRRLPLVNEVFENVLTYADKVSE